jgi:hypothetical protein
VQKLKLRGGLEISSHQLIFFYAIFLISASFLMNCFARTFLMSRILEVSLSKIENVRQISLKNLHLPQKYHPKNRSKVIEFSIATADFLWIGPKSKPKLRRSSDPGQCFLIDRPTCGSFSRISEQIGCFLIFDSNFACFFTHSG